jgi:Uma2 family endonuclease
MPMMVQTSTDDAPELLALIERRRAQGLDRYDEWWEGVYRIVTGPTPEHGQFVVALAALLLPRAQVRNLGVSAPVNIGIDKFDARVPDLAVFRPDTERTSPAFLTTAELVVEVLSPRERPGEKLAFYATWNVDEYLEIDLARRSAQLLSNRRGVWEPVERSGVVELTVDEVVAVLPAD